MKAFPSSKAARSDGEHEAYFQPEVSDEAATCSSIALGPSIRAHRGAARPAIDRDAATGTTA